MNEIQKYFYYRQSLIDQYVKGDMAKREYLERNLDAVLALRREPFQNADTLEKGLFNYQYFNALAKEAKGEEERAAYYYAKKDRATMSVLKLMDYRDVEAYFIQARSPLLKGKLFEIVVQAYEMILHSVNPIILAALRREGVFREETRRSLIDGYINQKY